MEKKTAFLELPPEMVDGLYRQNNLGDISTFILDLPDKQRQRNVDNLGVSTDLTNMMDDTGEFLGGSGEINLINSKASSLGNFDINTPDRFEHIVEKIGEISMDHVV
jgi:hypothetical protein